MMTIAELNPTEAQGRLAENSATFIDVRDFGSYLRGHIPGAQHVGDHNIEDFISSQDKARAVIVYCYHGNSSRGGAAHLENHGFQEVYSMSGGFTAWIDGPVETGDPTEPSVPEPTLNQVDEQQDHVEPQKRSRRQRLLAKVKRVLGA